MDPMNEQAKRPFDVVLLLPGVNAAVAKASDFRRVRVEAKEPYQAQMSDEVAKAIADGGKGEVVHMVAPPGTLTHDEIAAQSREHTSSLVTDKVRVGL